MKFREASENRYYLDPDEYLPATPEPDEELAPWPAETSIVGKPEIRVDAYERVSGSALYTIDASFPDMLHAAILRCPHAHARVRRVDTTRAAAMPGVRAVMTPDSPGADTPWYNRTGEFQSVLLEKHCRYAGDEVAVVAAETEAQARDALRAIVVDYEVLPFVIDPEEALRSGAPTMHGDTNLEGEVIENGRGDVDAGFAEAEVTVEEAFTVGTHIHVPLESFGTVARWEGRELYLWDSTQGVFSVMASVSAALQVPYNNVHVKCPYIGGGFGAKLRTGKYTVLAALLARQTGRPVKLFLSREETFTCVGNRPGAKMRVRLGAKQDGTLTAISVVNFGTGGAYGGNRYTVNAIFQDLYRCPNVKAEERWAYTNAGPARAMRAPGFPNGAWALEQAMDMMADKLGLDPIELRRRNLVTFSQADEGQRPYTSTGLEQCMTRGAEAFGWSEGRAAGGRAQGEWILDEGADRPRRAGHPHLRRGMGMAACNWFAGDGGPPSTATVRVFVDGSVTLRTGASDLGTGTKTVAAQTVAEELGVPMESITVINADTSLPYHYSSGGSQTLPGAIPAVRHAAYQAKKQLLAMGADHFEVARDEVELRDGFVRVRGSEAGSGGGGAAEDEAKSVHVSELMRALEIRDVVGVGYRAKNPEDAIVRPFAAHFAEVEVNTLTGEVRVLRLLGAHDSGRVINLATYENQVIGGMTQGLGFGMTEHRVVDRHTGQVLTRNLHDYKVPTAMDVPVDHAVVPVDMEDHVCNNLGAKGLGEPVVIPTAPAIANAIRNACGARVLDAPMGPANVLAALATEGGAR